MNTISSLNTQARSPPLFPGSPRVRWCSLGDTFGGAAGSSDSPPFFSLSPSLTHTVLVCTRQSNLCVCGPAAAAAIWECYPCAPFFLNGNIYLGGMLVRKYFWVLAMCPVQMLWREGLSPFLACNQKERKNVGGQGRRMDRLWETLASLLEKPWPVYQTWSFAVLSKEAAGLTSKQANVPTAVNTYDFFPLKQKPHYYLIQ